jgi:ribosomal protein S18 acetylase RimI-like enzyme
MYDITFVEDDFMIRQANANDLEIMAKITTNAWKINYKGIIDDDYLEKRTVENFIKTRKETQWIENKNINTFLYEEKNIIKGFVSGYKNNGKYDCEIQGLYVGVEYQGKGIGTKLLDYMKKYFKDDGCKNMIIWTIQNLKNNIFYKRHGGKIKEEKEFDFGGKKYSGIGFVFEL